MAAVLTTASKVGCGHGGTVATESGVKLKVGGAAVLLETGVARKSVPAQPDPAACGTKPKNEPPPSLAPIDVPCAKVTSVTLGRARKLTAGRKPVLLDELAGTTDGMVAKVPQTALKATANQSKLKAR